MPPPPPPPAAPPAPQPPPGKPATAASAEGGPPKRVESLKEELERKREKTPPIVPVPPPPKLDRGEEVLRDVTFVAMEPVQLYNTLQFGSQLLVLDVRPAAEYEKSHIRAAINVDWQKHNGRTLMELENEMPALFQHRRTFQVVVYDENSVFSAIRSNSGGHPRSDTLTHFLTALKDDQRAAKPVAILEGGLEAFEKRYPFLVVGNAAFLNEEMPSEILDGWLFLGNLHTAQSAEGLSRLGITHIVNMTCECENSFPDKYKYLQCAIDDTPDAPLMKYLAAALDFLHEAHEKKGRVLVHCRMGMSRSPSIIIYWIMKRMHKNLRDAVDYVRERRPYINPNPGFLQQLGEEERKMFGNSTIRFPVDGKPVTTATIYEWQQADGSWKPRQTASLQVG